MQLSTGTVSENIGIKNNSILELRGVTKQYSTASIGGSKRLTVLSNISLELAEGETLVIQGRSGVGKSTLARCILGIESIQSGSIRSRWGIIQSADAQSNTENRMTQQNINRRIQLVPQSTNNNVNPYETMRKILLRTLSSVSNARSIPEILRLSGLESALLDRRAQELSGGQRQRVLIARALCMNPDLIIFDEPVSNLDVSIQARIVNTLWRLKENCALSFIFITHDSDLAHILGDRILRIENGGIVYSV